MVNRYRVASVVALVVGFLLSTYGEARIDPDSIVGIWLFDDDGGNEALDSSKNERHGEINGNPSQIEGVFGEAIEFPGAGETVEFVGFGLDFPTDEITIVTWARVDEVKDQDLCSMVPLDPDRIVFHMPWGQGVTWAFGGAGFSTTFPFDDAWVGEWKHWAVFSKFREAREDKISGIYLDGEELRFIKRLAGQWVPRDSSFHIGGRPGSSFAGAIDEFAIFNTVLSQEDIQRIKNQGLERAALNRAVDPRGKIATAWASVKELNEM